MFHDLKAKCTRIYRSAYRSGVKVGDSLFCTIEPDNKHCDNPTVVKSGNDDIVGHVPETLAKKLFNFMKS